MRPVGSAFRKPLRGMLGAVPVSILAHTILAVAALLWALHEAAPPRPVTPDVAAQIELVLGNGADHNGGAPEASPSPPDPKKPEEVPPEPTKIQQPTPPPVAVAPPPPPPAEAPDLVLPAPQPPAPPPPVPAPPAPPAPPPPAPAPIQAPASTAAPPSVRLGDGIVGTLATAENPLAFVQADGDPDNVAPDYPLEAARRHEMGQVLLALHVDKTGRVAQVDILRSSGSPRLDEAARKTLSAWRYRPAFRDGAAVPTIVQQNINFDP